MAEPYAEGAREAAECRKCKQPVWIVYHGPRANHTLEPRAAESATGEITRLAFALKAEQHKHTETALRVVQLEATLRAIRDHKVVGAGLGHSPTLKRMIEDALKGKGADE